MNKIAGHETSRGRGGFCANWYMAPQRRGIHLAYGIRNMGIRIIGNHRGHQSRYRCVAVVDYVPREHVITSIVYHCLGFGSETLRVPYWR